MLIQVVGGIHALESRVVGHGVGGLMQRHHDSVVVEDLLDLGVSRGTLGLVRGLTALLEGSVQLGQADLQVVLAGPSR